MPGKRRFRRDRESQRIDLKSVLTAERIATNTVSADDPACPGSAGRAAACFLHL
jgi:hypothetical protein